jgi:hypothetical protein
MNGLVALAGFFAVMSIFVGFMQMRDYESPVAAILFAAVFGAGALAAWDTPDSLERDRVKAQAEQAQRQAEATPRKVSEADGCTVYAFKPQDRWLYFTKCVNAETTTQNQHTVRSGKSSRTETTEIKSK